MNTAVHMVHGIRTKATNASWPQLLQVDLLKRFSDGSVLADFDHYHAGINAVWNHLFINRTQAKALAQRIELTHRALAEPRICIVAHSNGSNIAARAIEILNKKGIAVDTFIVIGSALNSDIRKNGIQKSISSGMLRKAICYVSPRDKVVKYLERFPFFYGSLGARGFHLKGKKHGQFLQKDDMVLESAIQSRVFSRFSHSQYFSELEIDRTFSQVRQDLNLSQ